MSGTCNWEWTGSHPWVKIYDGCTQGTVCTVPNGDGAYIGEQKSTNCEGPS